MYLGLPLSLGCLQPSEECAVAELQLIEARPPGVRLLLRLGRFPLKGGRLLVQSFRFAPPGVRFLLLQKGGGEGEGPLL